MLVERQLSVAAAAVGVAVAFPEVMALRNRVGHVPGTVLWVGTAIGAFGVLLGSGVASSFTHRWERIPRLFVWTIVGLGMSYGAGLGVLHSVEWWRKVLFIVAALLPAAALGVVYWVMWRDAHAK
jgi:hypothetical protein